MAPTLGDAEAVREGGERTERRRCSGAAWAAVRDTQPTAATRKDVRPPPCKDTCHVVPLRDTGQPAGPVWEPYWNWEW